MTDSSSNDSPSRVRVGVIGLGMMGQTHLDAYAKIPGVVIAAVSDLDPDKLSSKSVAAGNIEGQAQCGFDITAPDVKKYADGLDLIADPDLDIVDICVPTPGHLAVGLASLEAGKHTLIEKPLARTFEHAKQLGDAAEKAWSEHQTISMCAMCMRFWPAWSWLNETLKNQTFGKVHAATFRRVASFPGGRFYADGHASGGAILDLHIHDTDFVRHLFGEPESVATQGYVKKTGQPDHVLTAYQFAKDHAHLSDDAFVCAEGGWAMADGFGFTMRYTVNFEHATADFDIARGKDELQLHHDGKTTSVDLPDGMGYDHELTYFVDCVRTGKQADRVTLHEAAKSVGLIEQELASLAR